jgi:transcriptional regulator with XRE-family HTH domain
MVVGAAGNEVAEFARDLKRLRYAAGEPSYAELAKRTGFARSTLHGALRGDRLPNVNLVVALVEACGGDPEEWRERWLRVRQGLDRPTPPEPEYAAPVRPTPQPEDAAPVPPPPPPGAPPLQEAATGRRSSLRRRAPVLVVAAAVLAAAVVTTVEVVATNGPSPTGSSPFHSCSQQREYRVRQAGALLDRNGRTVGEVSAGDLVDAATMHTGPYAHRYYVTVASRKARGYVDQAKIHFVRDVCR